MFGELGVGWELDGSVPICTMYNIDCSQAEGQPPEGRRQQAEAAPLADPV